MQHDASIQEDFGISSHQETIEDFELRGNCLLHVMAMPDGFVCGQLLDFTDGRIRPAPKILHRQWSERHPGSSHCFSHLVLLPPVGLISRVARLLSSPLDGISLEGKQLSRYLYVITLDRANTTNMTTYVGALLPPRLRGWSQGLETPRAMLRVLCSLHRVLLSTQSHCAITFINDNKKF